MRSAAGPHAPSRRLSLAVWAAFATLVVVGLGAATLRARYLPDLAVRLEPVRLQGLALFGLGEPNIVRRDAELRRLDRKYASHPRATFIHIGLGAVLLALIPLQFVRRFRDRFRRGHRWIGRTLLIVGGTTGLSGLFFGVLHPFAGAAERVTIAAFGAYFLLAGGIAFARIRAGRSAEHREWMLRAVAVALGIATVRVVSAPLDLVLSSSGASPQAVFLVALWIGLGGTVAAGEWWVRRTRSPAFAAT